jgi:hypothetical protein
MRFRMERDGLAAGSHVSLDQRRRQPEHLKLLAGLVIKLGQSLAGHWLESCFGMLIH